MNLNDSTKGVCIVGYPPLNHNQDFVDFYLDDENTDTEENPSNILDKEKCQVDKVKIAIYADSLLQMIEFCSRHLHELPFNLKVSGGIVKAKKLLTTNIDTILNTHINLPGISISG